MSETDFYFVYGTLKVGGHFATYFDEHRVMSVPATLPGYDLYNMGWFPAIQEGNGIVHGELHEYKNLHLVAHRMDSIEGYNPHNPELGLYIRKRLQVETAGNGKRITANVYVFARPIEGAKRIDSGIWPIK
jgi:gamma-glutamylcyclotransferase (GGCT)/AIG2-like uncharacterized protein YtfP